MLFQIPFRLFFKLQGFVFRKTKNVLCKKLVSRIPSPPIYPNLSLTWFINLQTSLFRYFQVCNSLGCIDYWLLLIRQDWDQFRNWKIKLKLKNHNHPTVTYFLHDGKIFLTFELWVKKSVKFQGQFDFSLVTRCT